jgi:DNA-binding HxlR family transcriptional regulator
MEISADWRHLKSWLVTVRGKWDLAVLVNLDRGVERPGDLIETINRQAATDISWKVLIATLRRLEHEGYVRHREISRLPRVTKYWLQPGGGRGGSALARRDGGVEEAEAAAGPAAGQPG